MNAPTKEVSPALLVAELRRRVSSMDVDWMPRTRTVLTDAADMIERLAAEHRVELRNADSISEETQDMVTMTRAKWREIEAEDAKARAELADYKRLEAICEERSDVKDGPEGRQLPNEAMSILMDWRGE